MTIDNIQTNGLEEENSAKKVFLEDLGEKKLINRKPIITKDKKLPSDKKVKELSGEVLTSNLYDTIMPYKEFTKLDKPSRLRTLETYLSRGKSRKEIADAWGKKVQSIHDTIHRLRKELSAEVSEEIAPIKGGDINTFSLSFIKKLTGGMVQDWIVRVVDLLDDSSIQANLEIKKYDKTSRLSIKLSDKIQSSTLKEELLNIVSILDKDTDYLFSLELKE